MSLNLMFKPLTCINPQCDRCAVQIMEPREKCRECGKDLVEFDSIEWVEEGAAEDSSFELDPHGPEAPFHVMREQVFEAAQREAAPVRSDDTFTCPEDLTGCPVAARAKVEIPVDMYRRWVFLAQQISTEWIAYLKGEETEPGYFRITDMYFPRQLANAAHCEAADGEIQAGTIAAVHSHVGMKVFFSEEDCQHMNHLVELVVNRAGDILACARTKLECGRFHRSDAQVLFGGVERDMEAVKQLRGQIQPAKTLFQAKSDAPDRHTAGHHPGTLFTGTPQRPS